ncbi:nucleotidyl transferase AbiEii/AbiGii toxin family protein [Paenibacillus sp. MER 99-2]|uniref:nucleotidyl transferase AbiEii/AbiGii toxin family protein n=1 Tax=Paenibacillus sp. MER 99-2 TaxID=2939572 RepID=UPI00203E814E|nr:nucleotidyl transferase AbiEii/AbiGii toxin family protein [Paenibacillus sp. MER 99-2]MCM3170981.1 nucleotidyl transferase AbiEii/AbiGii toxin family protein [Paenibacillus sp. MER 99-2]
MSEVKHLHQFSWGEKLIIALEALLRRASHVGMPFVLKGSLLTRQYLSNRDIRDAEDIDFLYMGKVEDDQQAKKLFTDWMIQVTELDLNDGVMFRSFRENAFWRRIDYAMADDFPTINTDLAYYFTSEPRQGDTYEEELFLDISFNLDMEVAPIPITYQPLMGEPFVVPYTVPLSIQVAWKLHQTIVRPRFKDLYDLSFLLTHPTYDKQTLQQTLQTLVNECHIDPSITDAAIKKVLVDDLVDLRVELSEYDLRDYAGSLNTDYYYSEFATKLREIMNQAGINIHAYENLPSPTIHKK